MSEDISRIRDEYEAALDEVEAKRAQYHAAIKKRYMSGIPLRQLAEELGISHQRVHQIVGVEDRNGKKSRRGRNLAGLASLLILVVLALPSAAVALGYVEIDWPNAIWINRGRMVTYLCPYKEPNSELVRLASASFSRSSEPHYLATDEPLAVVGFRKAGQFYEVEFSISDCVRKTDVHRGILDPNELDGPSARKRAHFPSVGRP